MRPLLGVLSLTLILANCQDPTATAVSTPGLLSLSNVGRASVTPFQAFAVNCPGDASTVLGARQTGNMLHLELLNTTTIVSENPMLAGRATVRVSVNINLRDPSDPTGSFTGSLVAEPTVFAGTWEGSFGGHLNGGRLEGMPPTAVDAVLTARGTGDLEGLSIKFDHQINPSFQAPPLPPGCSFGGEQWTGIIHNPAS